ncbi:hypothetical protein HBI38_092630 [Parastagonospora nodorum]|nr:hypothetical protein HBI10_111080 [Parastagonospora nodorum]KAH4014540.1 hypothetical protein HBI13_167410 [Parastagonospora nodorum]KAH4901006.1 hypothetical protein HBI80_146880 [Parastagonospora nodorum]KAH4950496.1 hypothetical protein HBH74_016070 [Parastagonospora nodorum]KAH4956071.1 hypothetical protein HBH73_094090 [Parastagonospora nodorum]
MSSITTVYLFGDQTDDARSCIRNILCTEQGPVLESFLRQSYGLLRANILSLGENEAPKSNFGSLLELLDAEFEGAPRVATEHALTSIAQFGVFFIETHLCRGHYPSARETYLMGLCSGSLTAAAVSCCRSATELLPVAVEVTGLSFRLGLLASETGDLFLCKPAVGDRSWAMTMPASLSDLIDEYIRTVASKDIVKASIPYVAVKSPKAVTICGPPHVLAQMANSEEFATMTTTSLPIYAPYHAEHVYNSCSITKLLRGMRLNVETFAKSIPIILKQTTANEVGGVNLVQMLSAAIESILMQCMDITEMTSELSIQLQNGSTELRIIPIVSGAAPMIQDILRSKTSIPIKIEKPNLELVCDTGNRGTRCKIAIVGSSGRFPQADNNEAFWDLLVQGKDVHKPVPASRWSSSSHVDTSERPKKNTSATPYGCWLENAGLFDARFFGMSPREAEQVDPAQRLALMATYEALEDGGIVSGQRSAQPTRVGVAFGVTSNDWMETNSAQNIDTYMIPGGNRAFIPGRINYTFKFSGPSYAVDTACSSSLAAIDVACRVLRMEEADTMIAGGVNIITNPDFTAGLDRGHFLSRTGGCKSFDDEADGYCRGEGVGVVVLKRLDDAIMDGDSIKGVLVDIRTNHSAEADSITRPHLKAQSDLFARLLNGLSPAKISYVEMHGTGTQVGDATEMSSVLDVIAPSRGPRRRAREEAVHLGSAKANVGHGEAVAGVTSFIKLLLMLEHDTIPPHVGIKTRLNRRFPKDLADRGVRIASAPVPWKRRSAAPRFALVNNFSAAGGNTALLLQDAPAQEKPVITGGIRPVFPVVISAKTRSALHANARALLCFLQKGHKDLPSLSYTTTARRMHHSHRLSFSVSSVEELISKLVAISSQATDSQSSSRPPSVCFVFTGQGGHYMGMGRELYHTNKAFRTDVQRFDTLVKVMGFKPFLPLIHSNTGDVSNFSAEQTQLAHVSLQMALCRLWNSWGIVPSSAMGHSLGYYTALNVAGILSDSDTLFAVGTRARLLQNKCKLGTHCMLAVKASKDDVEHLLPAAAAVDIACVNGPHDVVLSGKRIDIETVGKSLQEQQIHSVVLDTQFAFHSSQVDCILEDFGKAMQAINLEVACIPILCPRTGELIQTGEILDRRQLVHHCRETVDIISAIEAAKRQGVITSFTRFLEVGHNATVTSMLKATLGKSCHAKSSLRKNVHNWKSLTETVAWLYEAGANVQWARFHRDCGSSLEVVHLPHYIWDLKNYWIQYVNDWSLRKGEPALTCSCSSRPTLLSSVIHRVQGERIERLPATIDIQSDLSRPEMRGIAHGHKVNGLPLCTPSIYAEIAFTIGHYVQKIFPDQLSSTQVSIENMNIIKALVATLEEPQWLQTLVKVDEHLHTVCSFSTVQEDGTIIMHHADCVIGYDAPCSDTATEEDAIQINSAIKTVRAGLASGSAYRFNPTMVYRMVATLAEFDPAYRGLQEVVLDSKNMAATSVVSFNATPEDQSCQSFTILPTYIDCFSQVAGFIMNAHDASDLEKECFVNHGWGSLTMYAELKRDSVYECYVKMEKGEGSIWRGKLTVVCGDILVAAFDDLTLQGVHPKILHRVLCSAQKSQMQRSQSSPKREVDNTLEDPLLVAATCTDVHEGISSLGSSLDRLVGIVSEESGIERKELNDDVELAGLGIDSLLSLLIASRLKDDLDFDPGSGITFFDDYRTLGQLKGAYAKSKGYSPDTTSSSNSERKETMGIETPLTLSESGCSTGAASPYHSPERPVTSLVLQRASALDSKILFLFPDGSGSASSYTSLPPVSPHLTVVALLSPYRHDPENMACTLDALLVSYIMEIKRRQPADGYTLGGWSSGGVFAFRAAQLLLQQGDIVRDLLLLDSPPLRVGGGLGQLPERFYKHCREVGIFGQIASSGEKTTSRKHPTWLTSHFKATVNLLAAHRATPLTIPHGYSKPRVSLCWAGKCALDGIRYKAFEIEAGDSEDVRFLAEPRRDFGPGAWADLFPGITCHVTLLEQWDHFNMMVGDGAKDLSHFFATRI